MACTLREIIVLELGTRINQKKKKKKFRARESRDEACKSMF